MTRTEYDTCIVRAMTGPISWEDDWGQHARGRHKDFTGRPYRRGKTRCRFCGARVPANERLDPPPYRTFREGVRQALSRPSPFYQWLTRARP